MIEFPAGTTRTFFATLKDSQNQPVDLGVVPNQAVVVFQMRPRTGGAALSSAALVLQTLDVSTGRTVAKGRVSWVMPAAADPNLRVYRARFMVVFADGTTEFFPSDEFEDVVVLPDI